MTHRFCFLTWLYCLSLKTFVFKLTNVHRKNARFLRKKLDRSTQFGISHFAGDVTYDASEFIERNTDKVPESLLTLFTKSSNVLIREQFVAFLQKSEEKRSTRATRKKSTVTTVLDKFRVSLKDLMLTMSDTHTRYIRCIKPNDTMSIAIADHLLTVKQLQCAGLVTAIDLTRESFPNKYSFSTAVQRFHSLMNSEQKHDLKDMKLHDKAQYMMSSLFTPLIEQYRNSDFTMPFVCGKTKIFFRSGALEVLETQRRELHFMKASILQQQIRGIQSRSNYRRMKFAVISSQAAYRGKTKRSEFRRAQQSIILLQAWARRSRTQRKYLRLKRAVVVLQMRTRRIYHAHLRLNATKLQKQIRVFQSRKKCQCLKVAMVTCQDDDRVATTISRFGSAIPAVVLIQGWMRRLQTQARYCRLKRAVTNVQMWIRLQLARKMLARQQRAAIKIESIVRSYNESVRCSTTQKAASKISTWWRAVSLRLAFRLKRLLVLIIQSHTRGALVRKKRCQQHLKSAGTNLVNEEWLGGHRFCASAPIDSASVLQAWVGRTRLQSQKLNSMIGFEASDQIPIQKVVGGKIDANDGEVLYTVSLHSSASRNQDSLLHTQESKGWEDNALLEKLKNENMMYANEIAILKEDIRQVTAEAETHKAEINNEYEDRLIDYEKEVIELQEALKLAEAEKRELQRQADASKKSYFKKIRRYKEKATNNHRAHQEYLEDVQQIFEAKTARFLADLETLRCDKDKRIADLEHQAALLQKSKSCTGEPAVETSRISLVVHSDWPPSLLVEAEQLARDLYSLTSAASILRVVEASQLNSGSPALYIEQKVTSQVQMIVPRLLEMIELIDTDHDEKNEGYHEVYNCEEADDESKLSDIYDFDLSKGAPSTTLSDERFTLCGRR